LNALLLQAPPAELKESFVCAGNSPLSVDPHSLRRYRDHDICLMRLKLAPLHCQALFTFLPASKLRLQPLPLPLRETGISVAGGLAPSKLSRASSSLLLARASQPPPSGGAVPYRLPGTARVSGASPLTLFYRRLPPSAMHCLRRQFPYGNKR
jgi:hypothetical protein